MSLTANEKANLAFSLLQLIDYRFATESGTKELRQRAIKTLEDALEQPADIQQLP